MYVMAFQAFAQVFFAHQIKLKSSQNKLLLFVIFLWVVVLAPQEFEIFNQMPRDPSKFKHI
jgi:hypothetical protein